MDQQVRGTTLIELVLAVAILTVVFAAVVPLFTYVRQSTAVQAGNTEAIQSGRVLMSHLHQHLSTAVSIAAISAAESTLGYIEFVDNDANTLRYEVSNGSVYYGPSGDLSLLAGPVSQFQLAGYALDDLETATTDVNTIRLITVEATLDNTSDGPDQDFTSAVFLSVDPNNQEESDLEGMWTLDDGSGGTAMDSSENGNDGTLRNMDTASAWITGALDGALEFDGWNDYVDCGVGESLDITDDITMAFWVKVQSYSNAPDLLTKGDYTTAYSVWIRSDGTIRCALNGNSLTSNSSISLDTWTHVAITREGSERTIYINGQEDRSDTYATDIGIVTGPLVLSSQAYSLNGALDDVRLYSRALSQSEILDLMDYVMFVDFTEAKVASESSSITITTPSTDEDDLLVAVVVTDGDTSSSLMAPSGEGWTSINVQSYTSEVTLGAWWKLADVSESTSHEFTWIGNEQAYGWIMHFIGNDTTDPINDWNTASQTSATPTSPSVTTTSDHCLILRLGAIDGGDITIDDTGLSGHTDITMDSSAGSSSLSNPVGYWMLNDGSGNAATDSSGNDYHGFVSGGSWVTGLIDGALELDGSSDYVSLPIGSLIESLTDCTISTWVNWQSSNDWERVWDFGSSESVNMFLTTCNGTNQCPRFAITLSGYTNEDQTTASSTLSSGWHHMAVTIDEAVGGGGGYGGHWGSSTTITHRLYVDGSLVATNSSARYCPEDLGTTSNNYLGRSQYSTDPYYDGQLDDVRIYNETLSISQISDLAQWFGEGRVSGGAGYVNQDESGVSGTSSFSLSSSSDAITLTVAIAPK